MKNILSQMIQSQQRHVLVFSASWCIPCQALQSTIRELVEQYPHLENRIKVLDVDDHSELCDQVGIQSVPTCFFIDSTKIDIRSGSLHSNVFLDFLD
jgi:thioredoxin-like negative regulator of GroEL